MSAARFIEIDGKRYLWRDVLRLCREEQKALAQAQQPALFQLKEDRRPLSDHPPTGRFREPSLFSQ